MNIDEMVAGFQRQREELVEGIEEQRAIRQHANERIKTLTAEAVRLDRLIRAANGRKRKVIEDGEPQ